MKNVPFFLKFAVLLTIVAVTGIMATGYMASQAQRLAAEGAYSPDMVPAASRDVENAKDQVSRAFIAMLGAADATDAKAKSSLVTQKDSMLQDFNQSMTRAQTLMPASAPQLESLRQRGNTFFSGACTQAGACLNDFMAYETAVGAAGKVLADDSSRSYDNVAARIQHMSEFLMVALISALIIVLLLTCWAATVWITRPLNRLRTAMERLSVGDVSVHIPEADRQDEVGGMARAVMVFKDNKIKQDLVESQLKIIQSEMSAVRDRGKAGGSETMAAQTQVMDALAHGLEKLVVGDLEFRITQVFAKDYDKLRVDFNRTIDTLQQTMKQIAGAAGAVRSSVGEITQSVDDLSRRTEQQASSLEETAAALDEITATVRKASEGANEAKGLVNNAKTDAERSGSVVGKTIVAMQEIENSSDRISNIIGVIDEIAFQTNLLALNAGIEAARAGAAGRGFAVVATEVRALAQRSADAAKEIKGLISTSSGQVDGGVKLVNETGQALHRIVEQVAYLNDLVGNIANSSKEQATALEEVNRAVNQMDQVTQKNAAMVEKNTVASAVLVSEAEELGRLVGRFRTGAPIPQIIEKREKSVIPGLPTAITLNAAALTAPETRSKPKVMAIAEKVVDVRSPAMSNSLLKARAENDIVPKTVLAVEKGKVAKFTTNGDDEWDEF